MTPDEFKEKMLEIAKDDYEESFHIEADRLMCEVLEALGYSDGVKLFQEHPKWYS